MPPYSLKIYGSDSDRIVFLLGPWGVGHWALWPLSKILELSGFTCYTYAFQARMLIPNIELSLEYFKQVEEEIIATIDDLQADGPKKNIHFWHQFGYIIGLDYC